MLHLSTDWATITCLPGKLCTGFIIFAFQLVNIVRCRHAFVDCADALTTSPDILPGLCCLVPARPKIHLGRVALWKVVWIKPNMFNGTLSRALRQGKMFWAEFFVGVREHPRR